MEVNKCAATRPLPVTDAQTSRVLVDPPARRQAPPLRVAPPASGVTNRSSRSSTVNGFRQCPAVSPRLSPLSLDAKGYDAEPLHDTQRRSKWAPILGPATVKHSSRSLIFRPAMAMQAQDAREETQTDNPVFKNFDVEERSASHHTRALSRGSNAIRRRDVSTVPVPNTRHTRSARQSTREQSSANTSKEHREALREIRDGNHREDIRKALCLWNENPANFHQAACVFILGGKTADRKSTFPRPENVSRMTREEMKLAWEAASNGISKNEVLVSHFTSMESASMILGVDSPGFRASTVGQGGGGFFVCTVGPHELDWDQYQAGNFRKRTGQELWGEKWQQLLEGGVDSDKVEMVFFIKLPQSFFNEAKPIPGRELALIIPTHLLYEQDGYHWLQKEKIVKSYVLQRDAPTLEIKGEGPPPDTSLLLQCLFGTISVTMVFFQIFSVLAIFWNSRAPSCATNLQCERAGTFCSEMHLRCLYCSEAVRKASLPANATAFCTSIESYSGTYCDDSTAGLRRDDGKCAHPACRACPNHPGWGVPYRVAVLNTGGQGTRDVDFSRTADGTYKYYGIANSTWGTTSKHTVLRGNVKAMHYSDWIVFSFTATVVSFSLADETRDIGLCEITISERGGNSPLRLLLVFICIARRFAVIPYLASTVPILVLFGTSNAKEIALNAVGVIFVLAVDNEAFAYALPDDIRMHVEEYGRAEIGKPEARLLNSVKTWTWTSLLSAMIASVLSAKWFHDPVGGWMNSMFAAIFLSCNAAMFPGVVAQSVLLGSPGGHRFGGSLVAKVAVWTLTLGIVVVTIIVKLINFDGLQGVVVVVVFGFSFGGLHVTLWCLDKRDHGHRRRHFGTVFFKWLSGVMLGSMALEFIKGESGDISLS